MHRAPVVWICVLDGRGRPLPEPYEASRDLAAAPDMSTAHSVLIASEEQLKVAGRRGGSWGGGFPPSLWMRSVEKKQQHPVVFHSIFINTIC